MDIPGMLLRAISGGAEQPQAEPPFSRVRHSEEDISIEEFFQNVAKKMDQDSKYPSTSSKRLRQVHNPVILEILQIAQKIHNIKPMPEIVEELLNSAELESEPCELSIDNFLKNLEDFEEKFRSVKPACAGGYHDASKVLDAMISFGLLNCHEGHVIDHPEKILVRRILICINLCDFQSVPVQFITRLPLAREFREFRSKKEFI